MTTDAKTLKFLYGLQSFGIKVGLRNIRLLLASVGNPERSFASIHIAGTNGKGSTSAMIASIASSAGYRTGLYTSPHLISFNERIRINGIPIPDRVLARYTALLEPTAVRIRATFFEVTTAIAFTYFADQKIDLAVVETGLGGRLDATNVLRPLVTVISNISRDHTEYLGYTLSEIAAEKAGIMKRGTPCITAVPRGIALTVLKRTSSKRGAVLIESDEAVSADVLSETLRGVTLRVRSPKRSYNNLFVALAGGHQVKNATLALLALEELEKQSSVYKFNLSDFRGGMKDIRRNSGFRGRLEVLRRSPLIVADVAHNPAAVRSLALSIRKLLGKSLVTIFGVMKDKEYRRMMGPLAGVSRVMIAVEPKTERAMRSDELVKVLRRYSGCAIDGGRVARGVELALKQRRRSEAILIVGSHYVVGEAMEALKISH